MSTFKVGDRVQHIEDDDDPAIGTVISLPSHERVRVDFGAYYGRIEYPEDILKLAEPRPFKVGDVVDGIYDVPGHGAIIAEVFDTGHVITTWPNGSRHVEEKRFLKHAKPTVKAGDLIGHFGGAHIHFETWKNADVISSPSHYRAHPSGIEVIDITRHESFLRGNVVKYVLRAPYKNNELEDMRKAAQYLAWEIERLEGEQP